MTSSLLPHSLFPLPSPAAAPPRTPPPSAFSSFPSARRLSLTRSPHTLFSVLPRRRFPSLLAAADVGGEAEAEDEAESTVGDDPAAVAVAEEESKPMRPPIIKLGDIMGILNRRAVDESQKERPVPDVRTGDVVMIKFEVPENRRRLSIYKGIVISRQNAGLHTTIRIRRIIAGIGVEIVFPLYSPNIKELKVVSHRKVRRARLYYLRDKLPRLSTFK